MPSQLFDIERIRRDANVDQVVWQAEIASTNTFALEHAAAWGHDRVLVLTDKQTAGRGRGANTWWSSRGALTFSLWLRDSDLLSAIAPASLTIGTAVCDTIASFRQRDPGRLGIKWPNDIWLDDRKLGGVLVERPAPGNASVIGIGLNINNSFADAPNELRGIAASIRDAWGRELPLTDLVVALLVELQLQLNSLSTSAAQAVQRWQDRSILDQRFVHFRHGQREIQAVCRGIGDEGALLLETNDGIERFLTGTIEKVS